MRNPHLHIFESLYLSAILASGSAIAEVTTWTDSTGKSSVEAELVDVKEDQVTLRNSEGKQISVPLSRLSKSSQDYALKWAKQHTSPIGDGVVGLAIQVEGEDGVSPVRFYGFAVADSKGRVVIIAAQPRIAPPPGVEPFFKRSQLHPAFKKVDVYDLGTGKKLTTTSAQLFPEEANNAYKDSLLLIPVEKRTIISPLRFAAKPATDDEHVSIPIISPPDVDLEGGNWSKRHRIQLKKCSRKGSSFASQISRVDGKSMEDLNLGLPVLNEQGEVVEVVIGLGLMNAITLPLQDLVPLLEAAQD